LEPQVKTYSILVLLAGGIGFLTSRSPAQDPHQQQDPKPKVVCCGGLYAPPPIRFRDANKLVLDRKGQTIVLEPYAPNILRVTLSLQRDNALANPGYGFIADPNVAQWSHSQTELNDVYQSSRIIATVERDHPPLYPKLSTELDIEKYFNGSAPDAHITLLRPMAASFSR